MPTISSAGIGSGLDVNGLVEQLVAAEGEPVRKRLDRKEAELQAGLSAMGSFKGAVSEFQTSLEGLRNSETFSAIKASVENEDLLSVSATNEAQPGEYEIEVVQLADSHKLTTDAFDSDKKFFGTGKITIQLGEYNPDTNSFLSNPDTVPVTVDIKAENSSLRGIANAINKSEAPVRASVLNDGKGYRLVMSSQQEGSNGSIRVSVSDDDGADTDMNGLSNLAFNPAAQQGAGNNLEQVAAATDAIVNIDGIDIRRASNDFEGAIPGINFSLKPASVGSMTRIGVELDTENIVSSIQGFVEKYNEMINTVDSLTGYDPETRQAGPLAGDASIRGVVNMLRREIGTNFTSINERFISLASVGIDTSREGTLNLDESKLRRAIETDRQEVVNLFARAGFASDSLVEFVDADDNTEPGVYDLELTQVPSQGILSGAPVRPGPLLLSDAQNELVVVVNGISSGKLSLEAGNFNTLEQLANELEATINADSVLNRNAEKVNVEVVDGRLQLTSNTFGSNSSIAISAISPSLSQLTGLRTGQGQSGQDVAGRFNNIAGIGIGQQLTGRQDAEGLKIRINGGQPGNRGQITFSHGVAARLDKLLASVLDEEGILNIRTDGFNSRIESIGKEREKLARRLAESEKRYMKEFTAMDEMVGKMKSTGEYLSRQLASLPGAQKAGNGGKG